MTQLEPLSARLQTAAAHPKAREEARLLMVRAAGEIERFRLLRARAEGICQDQRRPKDERRVALYILTGEWPAW